MRKISSNFAVFLLAILVCLSLNNFVVAQEITGSIVGTVKDASGAVVPGANITIADADKGNLVVRTITTNDDGEFKVPNLPVGIYQITVEAKNFKKIVKNGNKLDLGQVRTVDIVLEAGNITEVVTVEADPVAVDLQSASSGTLINGDQVREIPVNNRNFVQLTTLAPGVSNDLADQVYVGTTNPDGQANTVQISVNGARSSQNTYTVDGADVTDRGSNLTIQAYPSVDSIGEFRVLRSLYPAEAGRSGGGQINVVTRSGGKKFSGSAYMFTRNEAFNANSFLNNAVTNPQFGRDPETGKAKRPPFKYYDYGWTLGGPVYFLKFGEGQPDEMFGKYDKTFFFFSQEFRRDRRYGAALTTTVPDASLRNGVFPINVCINPIPTSGVQSCSQVLTAGTPIPTNQISPTALAYLNGVYRKLPLPNTSVQYQLSASLPGVADFRQEIFKLDHNFSKNWSGYYRYQQDKIPTIDANAIFSSGSRLPGVSTLDTNSPGKTHTVSSTYVVSPSFIIEGRYNYSYGAIIANNIGYLSLDNTPVPVTLPFPTGKGRIPSVAGNGFSSLVGYGDYDNFSNKHNIAGNVTWIFGNHSTKFGALFSRYRKYENALASSTLSNNEGNYSSFNATLAPGVTSNTTNQNLQRWANFLVGNVAAFNQAKFDYFADLRQITFEAFAQDEWRTRNNLTLYYGVRYSYFPSPWDKNGDLSTFDPSLYSSANAPQVTGAGARVAGTGNFCNGVVVNAQNYTTGPAVFNCTPTASKYGKYVIKNPKRDFAPRVGLAWDPFGTGRTSVRTGYGIYHEQVLVGTFEQNIGTNVPYQQQVNSTNVNMELPGGAETFSLTVPNLRAVDPDWKTPYMQHWSLDVQRQVFKNTIVSLGYYGSKGTHIMGLTEINSIATGVARNSKCAVNTAYYAQNPTLVTCQPNGYAFRNTSTATGNPNTGNTDLLILDQIRPFKGFRSIAMVKPQYISNYHSMQLFAQHRFTGASQINLSYTWSKNLTNSQNDRTTAPQDSYDLVSEYARAALDRRHILSINYVYEIPFFKKQEGFVGKALGGWQASGIITYNTGLPFTVTTSNLDYAGLGIINANPAARPNLLCDPNANAPHTRDKWFDTSCFQLNPLGTDVNLPLTAGNAQRGIVNGPPTTRIDFTLSKNIKFNISEKTLIRVQLRAEVFNILNHTNFRGFTSLNVTASTTSFGQIGTTRDPRTMQFGAKVSF
ncbi:MAG: carboxypeptidase regulatory-like domain-containing protein [Pyrinomonadaceae bacterium]|nr:carboxypeptidase regulatory-like domain-containing protein [Pyrinomonadaceae bacterium]